MLYSSCIDTHTHTRTYTHTHTHTFTCTHTHICTHMHTHTYTHAYTQVHTHSHNTLLSINLLDRHSFYITYYTSQNIKTALNYQTCIPPSLLFNYVLTTTYYWLLVPSDNYKSVIRHLAGKIACFSDHNEVGSDICQICLVDCQSNHKCQINFVYDQTKWKINPKSYNCL